ncbi:hypothetical protein NGRA_0597 [Nosema granulosis]|uniref:Uncharacterized protein n=1 Tax=Nosema granulosis TaxID=83296 RepID=A0A9P6KZF6_9MICR|nr:hypothetical protein NGRA_0597 [Nosema granulosis]
MMKIDFQMIYQLLYAFRILETTNNGTGVRFMKRSLFYIPLVSLFIATAVRLFTIIYRLGDLNSCILEINDVVYDSRNNDFILFDFSLKNCTLPANCEFVNTAIQIQKNDVSLVRIIMSPFDIEKNTPIRIKCPIKVSDINLFEFINLKDNTNLELDFTFKLKVRFLYVIIPIGFNYSLKLVNPSSLHANKTLYSIRDTKIIGDLDKIRLVTHFYIRNVPSYVNINHQNISLESSCFKISISPILIKNGVLKKEVRVEIKIFLKNNECCDIFRNVLLKRKNIKFKIDSNMSCMIERIVSGYILIFEIVQGSLFKVFLCDKNKNSISLLYEFTDTHLSFPSAKTFKTNINIFEQSNGKELDKGSRVVKIGEEPDTNFFRLVYEIEKQEHFTIDYPVEIINISIIRGYVAVTFKISLKKLNLGIDIDLLPSLLTLECIIEDKKFIIPTIQTIKSPDLYVSIFLNEEQLVSIFESLYHGRYKFCTIKTVRNTLLDLIKIELSLSSLIFLVDNEVIYKKDFRSKDSGKINYTLFHELVEDNGEWVKIKTKSKEQFCKNENIQLFSAENEFNFVLSSQCLTCKTYLKVKNFILTKDGQIFVNLEAESLLCVQNTPKISPNNIFSYIFGGENFNIKFGSDLKLEFFFNNVNCDEPGSKLYENTKIMINEVENLNNNVFSFLIDQKKYKFEDFTDLKIINIFIIHKYILNILQKSYETIVIEAVNIEISIVISQDKICCFFSREARIDISISYPFIDVIDLEFKLYKYALIRFISHFLNLKENSFLRNTPKILDNIDHPIRFEGIFEPNDLNETVFLSRMFIHKTIYEMMTFNFHLLERRINLCKNGTCLNIKFKKQIPAFKTDWIKFVEFEVVEKRGILSKKDVYELEILDKDDVLIHKFTLKTKPQKSLNYDYGQFFFSMTDYKKSISLTHLFLCGRIIDTFLLKEISDRLITFYSVFFKNLVPNYNLIDIQICKLDILRSIYVSNLPTLVDLINTQILFNIQLRDFLKDSVRCKKTVEGEILSDYKDHYQRIRACPNTDIAFRENEPYTLNRFKSNIQFDANIRLFTRDSKLFIDISKVEFNNFFNFWASNTESCFFTSFFKIDFLKDNLFVIVFTKNFQIYLPKNDNLYLEVREDNRIFLQLLLNPSTSSKKMKYFYILGYTSLSFLSKDLIFIFKRFFGYDFTVDLKLEDELIVSSRITHHKSYMPNLALTSFSLINFFASSTAIIQCYNDLKGGCFGDFSFYEDEYFLDKQDMEILDEVIDVFKRRIYKKARWFTIPLI